MGRKGIYTEAKKRTAGKSKFLGLPRGYAVALAVLVVSIGAIVVAPIVMGGGRVDPNPSEQAPASGPVQPRVEESAHLRLEGMMSIYGGQEVEARLRKRSGIARARVSFFGNEAWMIYDPAVTNAGSIVEAINRDSGEWPYARAALIRREQGVNLSLPQMRSPSPELVAQVRQATAPREGDSSPAGFKLSLSQAARFIAYNDRVSGLPADQQSTIREGLHFTLVCCPPAIAWQG